MSSKRAKNDASDTLQAPPVDFCWMTACGNQTDMPTLLSDVRCWGQTGKHLLAASISEFDPIRTSTFLATY
jgi:hypothetical protein